MLSLILEYEIVGNELKNIGWDSGETTDTQSETSNMRLIELICLIKKHNNLKE